MLLPSVEVPEEPCDAEHTKQFYHLDDLQEGKRLCGAFTLHTLFSAVDGSDDHAVHARLITKVKGALKKPVKRHSREKIEPEPKL